MRLREAKLFPLLLFLILSIPWIILRRSWSLPVSLYSDFTESVIFFMGLIGIAYVSMRLEKMRFIDLGFSKRYLLVSLPFLALFVIFHLVFAYQRWIEIAVNEFWTDLVILNIIKTIMIIGFFEEIAYRGYFQNSLLNKCKPIYAILLASICFAGMHIPVLTMFQFGLDVNSLANFSYHIRDFLEIFFSGISLGIIYYYSKNIYIVSFQHGFYDLTIFYHNPLASDMAIDFLFFVLPTLLIILLYKTNFKFLLKILGQRIAHTNNK